MAWSFLSIFRNWLWNITWRGKTIQWIILENKIRRKLELVIAWTGRREKNRKWFDWREFKPYELTICLICSGNVFLNVSLNIVSNLILPLIKRKLSKVNIWDQQ